MFRSKNTLQDPRVLAIDEGIKGGDYTAWTVMEIPGPIRRFLRRIKVDRSKWQYKIISTGFKKEQ